MHGIPIYLCTQSKDTMSAFFASIKLMQSKKNQFPRQQFSIDFQIVEKQVAESQGDFFFHTASQLR